jgi:hypothetical protein
MRLSILDRCTRVNALLTVIEEIHVTAFVLRVTATRGRRSREARALIRTATP